MVYRHSIKIPFQDIDAAGVVFYAHLFRYAHEAYEAFMADIKQPLVQFLDEGKIILPLVHAEADYHLPLHYADLITLELVVEKIGANHFCLGYRGMNEEKNCVASIKTVHVTCDAQTKNKMPMPTGLQSALAAYQIEEDND